MTLPSSSSYRVANAARQGAEMLRCLPGDALVWAWWPEPVVRCSWARGVLLCETGVACTAAHAPLLSSSGTGASLSLGPAIQGKAVCHCGSLQKQYIRFSGKALFIKFLAHLPAVLTIVPHQKARHWSSKRQGSSWRKRATSSADHPPTLLKRTDSDSETE